MIDWKSAMLRHIKSDDFSITRQGEISSKPKKRLVTVFPTFISVLNEIANAKIVNLCTLLKLEEKSVDFIFNKLTFFKKGTLKSVQGYFSKNCLLKKANWELRFKIMQ